MRSKLTAVFIANLVPFSAALAADQDAQPGAVSGSAEVGVLHTNNNTKDQSKANEYRDLHDGIIGDFELKYRGDTSYADAFGENLGRDDQYLNVQGGQFGVFKFRVYDNELRHNLSNGITPYAGVGGTSLTGKFPATNLGNWVNADFSLLRKDYGGAFEWSSKSPWYFRLGANQVTTSGLRPMGGSEAVASPGRFIELPAPSDFRTTNYSIEGGYSSMKGTLTVNLTQSRFENGDQQFLRWQNPAITTGPNLALSSLAPDNTYSTLSATGALRQLPYDSTLAGRFNYGRLTDSVSVPGSFMTNGVAVATGVTQASNATSPAFSGNNVRMDAQLSLTSQLATKLDSRVYFNYNRLQNNSTAISFTGQTAGGLTCDGSTVCTPIQYQFKNNDLGMELNYRFTPQRKVSGGVDYLVASSNRTDYDRAINGKVYLEYKDTAAFGADWISARLRYQYLNRRADNLLPNNLVLQASNPINGAFDSASVEQNLYKLVLDADPVPFLNLGVEGIYKRNNYPENVFMGRTSDSREELYLNAAYGDPSVFRVSAYVDLEYVEQNAAHRYTSGAGVTSCSAPGGTVPPVGPGCDATAGTSTANPPLYYNWTDRNADRNWLIGVGADWPYSEKLKFKGSAMVQQNNTTANFSATTVNSGNTANLLPIPNYGSSQMKSLNLRGIYAYDKQVEFTGGYAFQLQRVSDVSYMGYTNVITFTGAAPNQSYLTGAYANPNYTTNIVYLMAKYKF